MPNYASLESDFRTVVLTQKWRGAENGNAKKRERTEARERDRVSSNAGTHKGSYG